MTVIHILNGPNLNLLGTREPEIYGSDTLADVEAMCIDAGKTLGLHVECRQSNIEGELVNFIHAARDNAHGVIINAGGYSHTSVAIHDALKACKVPIFEVHISNIYARETFRHTSLLSAAATGVICGFGVKGYVWALYALADRLGSKV